MKDHTLLSKPIISERYSHLGDRYALQKGNLKSSSVRARVDSIIALLKSLIREGGRHYLLDSMEYLISLLGHLKFYNAIFTLNAKETRCAIRF